MASVQVIYQLVVDQTASDNQQRIIAEQNFNLAVAQDANGVVDALIDVALTNTIDVQYRQSCLLHLKRLVPKYWSAAFLSFVGPSCITEPVKASIRSKLMTLISDQDSKLRNTASYAIIQILQVDYPDEWSSLLDDLYQLVNSNEFYKMLGGLTVLKDLFDDLVTDEQFFEAGVGESVILHCTNLISHQSTPLAIRIEALKLFSICIEQLSTQLNLSPQRKNFIKKVTDSSIDLLNSQLEILVTESNYTSILSQLFKFEIYKCLNSISNNLNHLFTKKISQNIELLARLVVTDLTFLNNIKFANDSHFTDFTQLLNLQSSNFETSKFIADLFSELFQYLTALSSKIKLTQIPEVLQSFSDLLVQVSVLPESLKEDWSSDFNTFVTHESGLSIDLTIRAAVSDYISDLTHDSETLFIQFYNRFNQIYQSDAPSDIKESILFLLGSIFANDEAFEAQVPLVGFLNEFLAILQNYKDEFIISRLIMILPKFFEKFESQIDVQLFGLKTLQQILQYQYTELTKSAILFSFTYFNYFIRSKNMNSEIQQAIIQIITDMSSDSDEDTDITLLESLSILICIDNKHLAKTTSTLELILAICFHDASNLGLIDSGRECLNDLMTGLSAEEFMVQCDKGLPYLMAIVNELLGPKVEFFPNLDLALELLITFVDEEKPLTPQIFNYIFPSLTQLILATDDDQLLQLSNEVLNLLLNHPGVEALILSVDNGLEILLQIVSKYLSPDLSDQAILNIGGLITKLIENFANNPDIGKYLEQILQAVTKRLLVAKEFPTVESLILIFANLAIASPPQTIEFLANFDIGNGLKLITQVIPIWLSTFETVRGYSKIVLNVRALIEVFLLNDPRVNSLMVNSDELEPDPALNGVIITRSMRKNLKFIQISVPVKIVKLFVNELKFQLSQPDINTVKAGIGLVGNHQVQEQLDDEWEDLNEYEEFAQYDEDEDEDDEERVPRSTTDNEQELSILKAFFKRIGTDEYFQQIFGFLKVDEQKLLTDFVNS